MVKQKMVFKLHLGDKKKKSKAMKIIANFSGIISVQVDGEKDQIIVIGEGVDPVCLTKKLRKKMGHVELIIVAPVKVDKPEIKLKPIEVWQGCHSQFIQHPFAYEYCGKPDPYCVIL